MSSRLAEAVFAATGGRPPAPEPLRFEPVEPPVKEATAEQVDAVQEYLGKHVKALRDALPSAVRYELFQLDVAKLLPRIAGCTPASLRMALLTCAKFGLRPDGYEAAIQVQGRKAVFIPRWQGYVKLMLRADPKASVHCGLVYETDTWRVRPGMPAPHDFELETRPELGPEERGKALFAYAFLVPGEGQRSKVVTVNRAKAAQIRDEWSYAYKLAEQTNAKNSHWHRDFDHQMQKTALKQLFPYVATSAEVLALVRADDAGDRGEVQVVHAPDPERAALLADAERAHRAAEGSQETRPLPVKRNKAGRRCAGKKRRGRAKGR